MYYIIYSLIFSLLVSLLLGIFLIPLFKKLKLKQYIRDGIPETHIKKSGTPTFGGFIFILATLLTIIINIKKLDIDLKFCTYSLIVFCSVGFIDDTLKTLHKNNKGLSILQKSILLLISSIFCTYFINKYTTIGSCLIIPFIFKTINLKIFYLPFIVFFYIAVTNSVNLTDGLDGLAAGITILITIFFTIVSFKIGKYPLSIFCGILSGSLMGFLWFNTFPAKIIMGDTGALALGGVIASISIILKLPLIIILVGFIYLLEALTVLIQIIFYKFTGKRVFRMAPIHHSFELAGWHEVKIVAVFSIITAILCLISFLSI